MTFNAARDGRVHVMAEKCSTCIFRPGNLMHLRPGVVAGLIEEAVEQDGSIICHKTLDTDENAVCRGFFDAHPTAPLQIAERLGCVEWQASEQAIP